MGWKNWSYWLRGGVVVLFVYILVIDIYTMDFMGWTFDFWLNTLLGLILSFGFGALIGFIYGKIKNRKKGEENG